jgi:phage FluMu protein Com
MRDASRRTAAQVSVRGQTPAAASPAPTFVKRIRTIVLIGAKVLSNDFTLRDTIMTTLRCAGCRRPLPPFVPEFGNNRMTTKCPTCGAINKVEPDMADHVTTITYQIVGTVDPADSDKK